jgi:hypothetical protein
MSDLNSIRDEAGKLPAYAWPGGYPIVYLTKDGSTVCPECANREVDEGQAVVNYFIHWEGEPLICEDCNKAVESAYGVPDHA